jgi:hypothetical protein
MGFVTVAVPLTACLAFAGFALVLFDLVGFFNGLAPDFRFGALCTFLVAFFAVSFACCAAFFAARFASFAIFFSSFLAFFSARFSSFAAFFSAFLAFLSAISAAFVFFAISASVESIEDDAQNRSMQEPVTAQIAWDVTPN